MSDDNIRIIRYPVGYSRKVLSPVRGEEDNNCEDCGRAINPNVSLCEYCQQEHDEDKEENIGTVCFNELQHLPDDWVNKFFKRIKK